VLSQCFRNFFGANCPVTPLVAGLAATNINVF